MIDGNSGESGRGRILVVGGTGVVGAPIVKELDRAGWQVRVASRKATQAREKLGSRVELVDGDVNSREDMTRALECLFPSLNCRPQCEQWPRYCLLL